jgi:hypothetical protein
MDTRQIICCLRDVGSFLGLFPSDLLPQHSIARSGTLIVNTDPHIESGSHWLAIHFESSSFTAYNLIPMAFLHLFPPYKHLSDAIAPSGITTRYSYKDLLQRSAANITVSSPCTWIEVILHNNSSGSLPPRMPTSWFPKFSRRSLARYARCREEEDGNAAPADIKRKSFLDT